MSFKGRPISLVREEYRYDANTNAIQSEQEYHGTRRAAIGEFVRQSGGVNNVTYQTEGAIGRVVVTTAIADSAEYTERYEVLTEFVEKDIFQIPAVALEAKLYDAAVDATGTEGDPYYREAAEQVAANKKGFTVNPTSYPLFQNVVRYLRDGAAGYEVEYVVIRRSRRIPRGSAVVASIGDGLNIYSTAQLGLPSDVAFAVPDSSALESVPDYLWGWRRRPSNSTVEGTFLEQSSEFILAQWSTLAYTPASGGADW